MPRPLVLYLSEEDRKRFYNLDDDGRLSRKFINKRINALKERIEFDLSLEDLLSILEDAGIKSSDWGFSTGNKFVLCRYRDCGSYSKNNCRFASQHENALEKVPTEASLEASRKNAEIASKALRFPINRERMLANLRKALAVRQARAVKRRQEEYDLAHPSYRGARNSQYGSYWITDGSSNAKWRDENGPLPFGFIKGRHLPGVA